MFTYEIFQEALKKKQQPPATTPSPVSTSFVAATPLAAATPTVPALPVQPQLHTDVRPYLLLVHFITFKSLINLISYFPLLIKHYFRVYSFVLKWLIS